MQTKLETKNSGIPLYVVFLEGRCVTKSFVPIFFCLLLSAVAVASSSSSSKEEAPPSVTDSVLEDDFFSDMLSGSGSGKHKHKTNVTTLKSLTKNRDKTPPGFYLLSCCLCVPFFFALKSRIFKIKMEGRKTKLGFIHLLYLAPAYVLKRCNITF